MMRVIVKVAFADRDNFSIKYAVGEELVGFDEERIAKLVERGLAVIEGQGDIHKGATELIAIIKETTDVETLNEYLKTETESEKPRTTVLKAIEERIAKLVERD